MGVNQWKCTINLMCTNKYKVVDQWNCMLKFVCTEKFKHVISEGGKDMYRHIYVKLYIYVSVYIYIYKHKYI